MQSSQQRYEINDNRIGDILHWVKTGEIAIPEIQRPFVWKTSKVRDLMDSLYRGYPVGYLIVWQNPTVKLKDGSRSVGKKILIDGQQRVTALRAAVLGETVLTEDYEPVKIRIAFHPVETKFEVQNPVIKKDISWIPDISTVLADDARLSKITRQYCDKNPGADEGMVEDNIDSLRQIITKPIGIIKLNQDLDIDMVNEIFERVNSSGVQLKQYDFAMSKIAVYGEFGTNLRKMIDYFAHLAVYPDFYNGLNERDRDFANSGYLEKVAWLKDETDDLYDPSYGDVLRVAFTSEFERGRISDLVSLLSGRNFETREFEQEIQDQTFRRLEQAVLRFANQSNFNRFTMIIKSAGFISSDMIRSINTLNASYILYLKLRAKHVDGALIEKYVRRWFVMSILTGRYSGSPESKLGEDVKGMAGDFDRYLDEIERGELSDAFWDVTLVRELEKPSAHSPFLHVFFAAQVRDNDKGFLSSDIQVRDMISQQGDKHHIFPKNLLKKSGRTRREYNQLANMAYMQTEINIAVRDHAPRSYLADVIRQCEGSALKYGGIIDRRQLDTNLEQNCIPPETPEMDAGDYDRFLEMRRVLMAQKIRRYFFSL